MGSSSKSDSQSADMKWMYDGQRSTVHREEYLTGRKVDRHFDKYGDECRSTDESHFESVVKRTSKNFQGHEIKQSVLDIETVKKEDPLVAIKVKEEQLRREILNNPVKMKRLKKIILRTMRKKARKLLEKGIIPNFMLQFKPSNSSSLSGPDANSSADLRKAMPVQDTSDVDSEKYYSDDSEQQPSNRRSYGLQVLNKSQKSVEHQQSDRKPLRHDHSSLASTSTKKVDSKKTRKKMTEEEMERKRREMEDNARWREEQRHVKLKRYAAEEAKEREEQAQSKNAGTKFLKMDIDGSVEDRIRSKKQSLQRRHNAMESNFVKK